MQFRWVIPITLWTLLAGPVLVRPRTPAASPHAVNVRQVSTNHANSHK
jgi:hypothetical protein